MHAIERSSRRGQARMYFTCNDRRVNGACDNSMSAIVEDVDAVVLEVLRRHVLSPDIIAAAVTRAIELYQAEPDRWAQRHQQLAAEATRLQDESAI